MDVVRARHQFEERQIEQRGDPLACPAFRLVIPAQAGIQRCERRRMRLWIPAFAGMTIDRRDTIHHAASSDGGMLWPSKRSTSSAAATRLVPGPKIACTPAS